MNKLHPSTLLLLAAFLGSISAVDKPRPDWAHLARSSQKCQLRLDP